MNRSRIDSPLFQNLVFSVERVIPSRWCDSRGESHHLIMIFQMRTEAPLRAMHAGTRHLKLLRLCPRATRTEGSQDSKPAKLMWLSCRSARILGRTGCALDLKRHSLVLRRVTLHDDVIQRFNLSSMSMRAAAKRSRERRINFFRRMCRTSSADRVLA